MNVNKKFDRFKQWAGEKMGGEAKTGTSDNFKMLEMEMNLRHEGMDKLHKSMSLYVKHIGKKSEGEDRDKIPLGNLGSTMISHGQDFAPESEFGTCLIQFGKANEGIARRQEAYVSNATSIWLESLEKSLAQLKEYQAARKKLEARRLAYDASLAKMQKAKKEDFRVEEELRAQKAKYEESSEDVYRRMEDIKEAEVESVVDLTQFLDAELAYHESCRNILYELRKGWPATTTTSQGAENRKLGRARSNTAHSFTDRFSTVEEQPPSPPARPAIPRVARKDSAPIRSETPKISRANSIRQEIGSRPDSPSSRFESDMRSRDYSPDSVGRLSRTSTNDQSSSTLGRIPYRPASHNEEMAPPVRQHTIGALNGGGVKKAPPPPPPSRVKKPAPPPPMKRNSFSTSQIPQSPHY